MNRATAATLVVIISISGTGPLLAQRAEPSDSPSLERILKAAARPRGFSARPFESCS